MAALLIGAAFGSDNPRFDLDGDRVVDFGDFLILAKNFGRAAKSAVPESYFSKD